MSNPSANPQGGPRRKGAGYEKRDANAKWIFGTIGFLVVAGLIMHFVIAGVMERLEKRPSPTDQFTAMRHGTGSMAQFKVVPHLQLQAPEDLKKFRVSEESELNTYGWINRTAGVVRIPVARAMELTLERGLPTRSETNGTATGPSSYELQQQRPQSPQPEIMEAK